MGVGWSMGGWICWRYTSLGILRGGGGALGGNEARAHGKLPHAGLEEKQEGTSVNARQAEEEGTETVAEDMGEGRENTGKNKDWGWTGEENSKNSSSKQSHESFD